MMIVNDFYLENLDIARLNYGGDHVGLESERGQ
jgi:hypothetical protein